MFSLLISSDSYISSLRHSSRNKLKKTMFPETLELLRERTEEKNYKVSDNGMSTGDEESDDSDSI